MRLEPPSWWYGTRPADRLKAGLLAPVGWLYGAIAEARFAITRPYRSALPVICIGNFTLGGAGKTPLAIEVARFVQGQGRKLGFLTRGYGGSIAGPHQVDPNKDTASEVGDEALLLARVAPTFVARDRAAGAQAIERTDANIIIMDDGFQNPTLAKDLSIIAIDASTGFGNGWIFPAGPLRAPLGAQMQRASAIVRIGDTNPAAPIDGTLEVITAHIAPSVDTTWLLETPIIAFCGIGRPVKFFQTLEKLGAHIIARHPFPDHHMFSAADASELLSETVNKKAALVTTEKDWVRIPTSIRPLAELKAKARPLPIGLFIPEGDKTRLNALLMRTMGT